MKGEIDEDKRERERERNQRRKKTPQDLRKDKKEKDCKIGKMSAG